MNEAENTKEYEMSYLLTPEISEDKTDFEITELKKIIVENGGDTVQADPPEKKRLVYPIKKQNQAYFGVVYFNIGAEGLEKMKKTLALYKKILRYLILNKVIKSHPTGDHPKGEKPNPIIVPQSFDKRLEDLLKS